MREVGEGLLLVRTALDDCVGRRCLGCDHVRDLVFWLPQDAPGVHPAHANRAGAGARGEDGHIHPVALREPRGVAGDGPVRIQRATELNRGDAKSLTRSAGDQVGEPDRECQLELR